MSNAKIDLLKTIFTLEQEQLHDFLYSTLLDYYADTDVIESVEAGFIFAKGDIDVLLVSHLDTVHKVKPTLDNIFFDQEKGVIWSPAGIGADDRCGVFIILNLIFSGYKPHIAFTWDEEIGGVGARNMTAEFDPAKNGININFAIEFDRRGHAQSVYYSLYNGEFESYINSFGFTTHFGTYTDICEICPDWSFAGVNLSAGYINEHTRDELALVNTIYDTIEKASKILDDQKQNPKFYEYKELPRINRYANNRDYYEDQGFQGSSWTSYDDYYYYGGKSTVKIDEQTDEPQDACIMCGQPTPWYQFCEEDDLTDICNSCYNYIYEQENVIDEDDEDDIISDTETFYKNVLKGLK